VAGFIKKDFSLGREDDAARTTFEKVNADFVFQILDSPTQRRLRDAQERRRFREIQRFSDSQKISQVPEFHRGSLCQNGMAAQASWYWEDSDITGKLDVDGH
jgi:hypothetical protein